MGHTTRNHSYLVHRAKTAFNNSGVLFCGTKDANMSVWADWINSNLYPSQVCKQQLAEKRNRGTTVTVETFMP